MIAAWTALSATRSELGAGVRVLDDGDLVMVDLPAGCCGGPRPAP